jgi:hypothetical protein
MDLYETLGVDKGATDEQLRDAYRDKAKVARYDETGFEDGISDVNRKASGAIGEVFEVLLQKVGIEGIVSVDVIKEIKRIMSDTLDKMATEKEKVINNTKALKKAGKRVKHKDKLNILTLSINHKIVVDENKLKGLSQKEEVVKVAYGMLKDFKFKFDKKEDGGFAVRAPYPMFNTYATGSTDGF